MTLQRTKVVLRVIYLVDPTLVKDGIPIDAVVKYLKMHLIHLWGATSAGVEVILEKEEPFELDRS